MIKSFCGIRSLYGSQVVKIRNIKTKCIKARIPLTCGEPVLLTSSSRSHVFREQSRVVTRGIWRAWGHRGSSKCLSRERQSRARLSGRQGRSPAPDFTVVTEADLFCLDIGLLRAAAHDISSFGSLPCAMFHQTQILRPGSWQILLKLLWHRQTSFHQKFMLPIQGPPSRQPSIWMGLGPNGTWVDCCVSLMARGG